MPWILSKAAAGLKLLRGVSPATGGRLAGDLDMRLGCDAIPPPTDRALVGVRLGVPLFASLFRPRIGRSPVVLPLPLCGVFPKALSKTSCNLPLFAEAPISGPVDTALPSN
jgi:hypothetical protein